jgi:hypothetical protein
LVKESIDLRFVKEISSVSEILLFEVLEVSSISDIFKLNLSEFLDLVVVDVELSSLERLRGKLSLSSGCTLRILVADESISDFTFLREEFDVFDFTISTEEFFKLLLCGSGWEVLDVEVASLL